MKPKAKVSKTAIVKRSASSKNKTYSKQTKKSPSTTSTTSTTSTSSTTSAGKNKTTKSNKVDYYNPTYPYSMSDQFGINTIYNVINQVKHQSDRPEFAHTVLERIADHILESDTGYRNCAAREPQENCNYDDLDFLFDLENSDEEEDDIDESDDDLMYLMEANEMKQVRQSCMRGSKVVAKGKDGKNNNCELEKLQHDLAGTLIGQGRKPPRAGQYTIDELYNYVNQHLQDFYAASV